MFRQQLAAWGRALAQLGYYEYTGDDFESDIAALDCEPRNVEWHAICDPMQIPLPGAYGWTEMEQIYFNA